MRRNHILILCAAFVVTLPLITQGCSCGHDFDFHLQSWLDAAEQLRRGTLLPHWTFSAAYNAGEPRFIFYPPLSWMLGELLTLTFPIAAVPAIFTFIALAAAGFAMHRLASHFASPNAALLATVLYIANPYMLFTAFERTAYAELLAAAWLPLLFLAALRKRPTIPGIALPVALLWLTNAPAAVMGCYALAFIIIFRIVIALISRSEVVILSNAKDLLTARTTTNPGAPCPDCRTWVSAPPMHLALTATAGTILGLTLPAFYLIPAAYERRYVQIAMAIIPNMRFQDNFLFGHTADQPHNAVLHTASIIAITLLIATAAALITLYLSRTPKSIVISTEAKRSGETRSTPLAILTLLTAAIAILVTPISTPIWNHLPNLAFLQFPWRLLAILSVILALTVALLLRNRNLRPAAVIAFALAAPLTFIAIHTFRQGCDIDDLPTTRAQLFATHHGVEPTDEYTPTHADNDTLRASDPAYWLSTNPAAFAPNTTPNPAATDPNYTGSPTDTLSTQAPHHFTITTTQPETLILNLRDYPNWDITETDPLGMERYHPKHIARDDGLIAIPLSYETNYIIDITWRRTLDQQLGLALTSIAASIFAFLCIRTRSRRIEL